MTKKEYINVRVTAEEKKQVGARTVAAGLKTRSDYVRQILFEQHDVGEDMRKAWFDTAKELQQECEKMRCEWQAARQGLERSADILDSLGSIVEIGEKIDSMADEIVAINKMRKSLEKSIENGFSAIKLATCKYKKQAAPEPEYSGQETKAFLLGVLLGAIFWTGLMMIIK